MSKHELSLLIMKDCKAMGLMSLVAGSMLLGLSSVNQVLFLM